MKHVDPGAVLKLAVILAVLCSILRVFDVCRDASVDAPKYDPPQPAGFGASITAAIPMDNPYCSCKLTRVLNDGAGPHNMDYFQKDGSDHLGLW